MASGLKAAALAPEVIPLATAQATARALETGPETRGLVPSLPEGFRVRTV